MAAKPEIVQALIAGYNKELETVVNYLTLSLSLDGVRAEFIKQALTGDIQTELGHARQLGARIKQLGGVPPGSLALKMDQTYLQPPKDTTDLVSVIRGVLTAEDDAIQHYNRVIKLCDGIDYVTQDLAITLLA